MGARDSTSTRCALGTSSRVLRILTESGDVIRYVFLLAADLRQDILDVGGGGRPVFSSWDFVRFEVSRAAMSLGQSPLATSSGVCSSGWTVCYSGDKSRNSGRSEEHTSELQSRP